MGQYTISRVVRLPFARALAETRQALSEQDLGIIAEMDLQAEVAKRSGQQIRPYTIMGVWVPLRECRALNEPDIALLMPNHVCLWDNGNRTCTLATLCHAEENLILADAAREVNARLRAVLASVKFTGMTDRPQMSPHAGRLESQAARATEGRGDNVGD